MEKVNFFQLTRSVQQRFIDACHRQTVPKPILGSPAAYQLPWVWALLLVVSLVSFVSLVRWGYGSLQSVVAIAPHSLWVAYGVSFAVASFATLQLVARLNEVRRWPFRPGQYLFPVGVIDATEPEFKLASLSALSSVEVKGARLALTFSDGSGFTFKARDAAAAEEARERVVTAKRELIEASIRADDQELARLNPLVQPRYSNPLAPLAPYSAPVPGWRKLTPLFALLLGAVVALVVGYTRNVLSERALFAQARHEGTPEAYRAYIELSGKRDEVRRLLLPRAELEQIKARGNIEELERYSLEHPDSEIKEEVRGELRRALLDALNKAKQVGTLSALDAFSAAHPKIELVQQEVQSARKVLMGNVLRGYVDNHAAKNDDLEPFFQKLLEYLAQHGPEVQVRFHRIRPESVARADSIVRKDENFTQEMLPSQYFGPEPSLIREKVIFEHLADRFSKAFAPDALKLVLGEPIGPDGKLPEHPEVPTLFITHSTNMGNGIANSRPPGTFIGVGFLFKAYFVIPGQEEMLQTRYSSWRPPELQKLRAGVLTIPEVYTVMADATFEQFDRRVVRWLFRREK